MPRLRKRKEFRNQKRYKRRVAGKACYFCAEPDNTRDYPDFSVAEIDGLVQAAKVYSLVALEVCGKAD